MPAAIKRYRILLAEDDPVVQMATRQVLEHAAFSVSLVSNGHDAIQALSAEDYDLVLMDGSMPGLDGFSTTKCIRDETSTVRQHDIPVIALTGLDSQGDRAKCLEAGMNDYLEKPVDPVLLIDTIAGHLAPNPDIRNAGTLETATDGDYLDTIIDRFVADIPQLIRQFEVALNHQDINALKDFAHRTKGAADVLGASSLSRLAREVERSAKARDSSLACDYARQLIEALSLLESMQEQEDDEAG